MNTNWKAVMLSLGWIGCGSVLVACGQTHYEERTFDLSQGGWYTWFASDLDPSSALMVQADSALFCVQKLETQCVEQSHQIDGLAKVAKVELDKGCVTYLCSARCSAAGRSHWALESADGSVSHALGGWNVLQPEYRRFHLLDGLSLEWDYFMIHDKHDRFTGSVGYLISDPRGRLGGRTWLPDLVPSGLNAAIAGSFHGEDDVAEFHSFGLKDSSYSSRVRSAQGQQGNYYATITPVSSDSTTLDSLLLEGRTAGFQWSLQVTQDWSERGGFEPMSSSDVGLLPGEHWTVEMLWPRTRVTGSITNLKTGQTTDIDGHGYRENSWGRWAFITGGWDFGILSDEQSGVQWAWQTYHFRSHNLDFVDLSFYHDAELKNLRFAQDQISWYHTQWSFDEQAHQCTPQNVYVVAQNEDYRVEVTGVIGGDQIAMLSDITPITASYVIMIQFPTFSGQIIDRHSGQVITSFAGRGGGEFSLMRNLLPKDQAMCDSLFQTLFRRN